MDVTNGHVLITCKSGNTASALEVRGNVTSDAEVFDESIVREYAEETEEVTVCGCLEILDGVPLSVEVSLVCNTGGCPVSDSRPYKFLAEVSDVNVFHEDSIGIERAVVDNHGEDSQVGCCLQLIYTIYRL